MTSETILTNEKTGGQKGDKPVKLDQLPRHALEELGRVYAFAEKKYPKHNFRLGYDWSLSYNALQRHLIAFWGGEDVDPESGVSHMAHAMWHCATLLMFQVDHEDLDDRYSTVGVNNEAS